MNSLWTSKAGSDMPDGSKGPVDVADTGVAAEGTSGPTHPTSGQPPVRPGLQRNSMSIPPPQPPQGNQLPDSLSLAQLRLIVSEFPRTEAVAYDFVYSDTGPHAEEIDEWFVYQFWQWVRLNTAQRGFEAQWEQDVGSKHEYMEWDEATDDIRSTFVRSALEQIKTNQNAPRAAAVGRIMYIVLGRWSDTAGTPPYGDKSKLRSAAAPDQLAAMKAGIKLVAQLDGLPVVWTAMQNALDVLAVESPRSPPDNIQETQDELMNLMTIMYMTIQEVLNDRKGMAWVREKLLELNPNIASYMLDVVAKMRWMDGTLIPMTQSLLLLWKCILVVFGGTEEIAETKKALSETSADDKDNDIITASPLDYHVFRQEISSKYPAYVPPQLPLPLEADKTSLLPPLPNHPTRNNGSNGILPAPPNSQSGGASILHQPVHIATPAPSPPPSPNVGGKGGKKQNYQTNQNFPFMYPPLDATSNSAGGKGGAGLQDFLVGRKWEGSDIPTSIKEAGELFSKRVRMTRAIRQLWEERERFLKFERGWDPSDDDLDSLDLDALSVGNDDDVDDDKLLAVIEKRTEKSQEPDIDYGPNENLDKTIKWRLQAVEKFYDNALPQLQSVVMVLMKAVLYNVTACITMPQGRMPDGMGNNARMGQGGQPMFRGQDAPAGTNGLGPTDTADMSLEELDQARAREIEGKALTGTLLLLLKWFKISHILKFEYLTQLLLDSNYLPLVLKLFAHQDVQQVVDSKTDRLEHSFFQFCNLRALPNHKPVEPTEIDGPDDESEDDAMPPPIKRRKSPPRPTPATAQGSEPGSNPDAQAPLRPEVDELGYPVNPLPKEPITDFSRRNFFSLINYLRILQKICKNKAHRNLLLVQYKSSNIIRKSLKVPQDELRLYTLKLFKNQVPYCGRKWRQSNMRVITAVYLHCRPELRDEWLAGSDVDAEVEEALPLEQALRSLTHWCNVQRYPEKMAADVREALQEEQDFFKRELEKLEVNWPDAGVVESIEGEWGPGPTGAWPQGPC
ncbi:required for hyphal anastomosis [Pseudomassariella vexata]|uniref:Required for hyphal anastomosis n=1 Tax=Pseudomassariella vexata TaxID=1141098 RepID=A0A1Y2EI31_9PEZI|nr:required for hyphal anastomosis [Pseudomassariella vexata]ORY71228.1 required for hyphal anastomosis [Pseudomassariella vexata]